MSVRLALTRTGNQLVAALVAAVSRLDKSTNPQQTLAKLRRHQFELSDSVYALHLVLATFWLSIMPVPFLFKLLLVAAFSGALLVPLTSQFFFPAIPVFAWLLTYFTSRFIPAEYRPTISVSLLPTLESVLYGANISDILTRVTHPVLDIIAWIPYGVTHFVNPFVVAAFLWLFRPKQALHFWARAFGYLNIAGVLIQILLPCAPPWYELIYGLTPADYTVKGSAGGLMRIDAIFGTKGYQTGFGNSPVVFGAFPSLHSGCATIEALFVSHFFPQFTRYAWTYAAVLYWATMYLTHHYLIDVVAGACMATAFFYYFLPIELASPIAATAPPGGLPSQSTTRNKYATYDLDPPDHADEDGDLASEGSDDEMDIAFSYRSPVPNGSTNALQSAQGGAPSAPAPPKRSHKHTASIASLIREGDRVEEGWSPITGSFAFPPTPTRAERDDSTKGSRV